MATNSMKLVAVRTGRPGRSDRVAAVPVYSVPVEAVNLDIHRRGVRPGVYYDEEAEGTTHTPSTMFINGRSPEVTQIQEKPTYLSRVEAAEKSRQLRLHGRK